MITSALFLALAPVCSPPLAPPGSVQEGRAGGEGRAQQGGREAGERARRAQGPRRRGAEDIFDDRAAAAAADRELEALGRRQGTRAWIEGEHDVSVDIWSSLPGVRYDLLETTWINMSANGAEDQDGWIVHHRLPRLVHVAPPGQGYLLSEFVTDSELGDDFASTYQRLVSDGEVAWAEMGGGAVRDPDAERRAQGLIAREQFLTLFPLALDGVQHRRAFLREESDGTRIVLFRLGRPLQLSEMESARDFALYLDGEDGRPTQFQFETLESQGFRNRFTLALDYDDWRRVPLSDEVRAAVRERLVEAWRAAHVAAWVAAQPDPTVADPPAAVRDARPDEELIHVPSEFLLPYRRYQGGIGARQLTELWLEDPVVEGLHDGALERPWMTGLLFGRPVRADFWDPPPAAPAPGPEGGGGSEEGDGPGEAGSQG